MHRVVRQFSTKQRRRKGKPKKPSSKPLSRSSRNLKPLVPISQVLTSAKVQKQAFDKFIEFRKELQSVLMPQFMKDRPSLSERKRVGPIMDAKWWLWNIALACVPGLVVHAVCSFYKSDMENFYRQQQLLEDKANGVDVDKIENNSDVDDEAGIWAERKSSVWNTVKDIFGLESVMSGPTNDVGNESTRQPMDNESKTVQQKGRTIEDKSMQGSSLEQPNIMRLIQRIELLEQKLEVETSGDAQEPSNSRLRQSNVKRRRNDALARRNKLDEACNSSEHDSQERHLNLEFCKEKILSFLNGQKGDALFQSGTKFKKIFMDNIERSTSGNIESDNKALKSKSKTDCIRNEIDADSDGNKRSFVNERIGRKEDESKSDSVSPARYRWLTSLPLLKINKKKESTSKDSNE